MPTQAGMEVEVETLANPAYLGALADAQADSLGVPTFTAFQALRVQRLTPPLKPILAICDSANPQKAQVFALVNQQKHIQHQQALIAYERRKQEADLLSTYPGTLAGYGAYLLGHHPAVMAFFGARRPFRISEERRRLHTYVTGGSGSGKSECLKSLLWPYLAEDTGCTVILLDPHGDVALQTAQFKPNRDSGRLVYIDPAHDQTHFPCLNPFDCVTDKASLSDLDAEKLADEFVYVFAEILRGDLSDQMRTILINTLPVLMKYPDSSVYDLIDFLELPEETSKRKATDDIGEPKAEYKADKYKVFARQHYGNKLRVDFLFGQFEKDSTYRASRNSLQTRLNLVFGGLMMQTLFRGKRTVRLEELIPARKFVVFNLNPEIGLKTADTIGRFLLISLKIFALNQAKVPEAQRVPCHVFVDECQRFITPSIEDILGEARKFYVFLTLAQQVVGGGMDDDLFRAVRSNTGLKLTGANARDSLKLMADDTGADVDELSKLSIGRFSLWQRSQEQPRPPVTITMPTTTLKNRAGMTAAEWRRLLAEQVDRYYVSPEQREAAAGTGMDTQSGAAHTEPAPAHPERDSRHINAHHPKPTPDPHAPLDPLLLDISDQLH